ncbi:imm11 family protein [Ruminiclostridium cellobioparum]|uniref:Immunity MXAN-0049 protein domain-containing protein n=1 Tax=Ruminiclostridium cellobioparum subsp. termitidis CT1112 TaxID=1195236 RepID=S0FRC3_RUMCE|nr:DUF1629 domain-containing protein [Ruminiclostridium cellobioparum]EMS71038.1 hypothetical protein CTER_3249 [Ruminiclostridium cellobioparum subsp. termitidis CT1112]
MRYYLLEYSEDSKDKLPKGKIPILVNDYNLNGFDLRLFWRGIYVEKWPDDLEFYYEKGNTILDFVPNVLSWLMFTDKAVEVFKKSEIMNMQYFPIIIKKVGKKEHSHSLNVINVLDSVEALDWEKSDYVSWEDDPKYIKFIRKVVLNKNASKSNLDIFRLQESKNYIIVSERIRKAIENEGLTGFGFKLLQTD